MFYSVNPPHHFFFTAQLGDGKAKQGESRKGSFQQLLPAEEYTLPVVILLSLWGLKEHFIISLLGL